jgi:hypothetical protein
MKSLLFIGITTGTIYASLRWEVALYIALGLFVLGAAFVSFYSLYRHFAANRLL